MIIYEHQTNYLLVYVLATALFVLLAIYLRGMGFKEVLNKWLLVVRGWFSS